MAAPLVRVVLLSLVLCPCAGSYAQDALSLSDGERPGFQAGDFEQRITPFTRPGGPRVWAPKPAPAPVAAVQPSTTTIVILQGASQQPSYDDGSFYDGGSFYGGGAYYGGGPYYGGSYYSGGPYYGGSYSGGRAFYGLAPRYGSRRLGPFAGPGPRPSGARMGIASPRFGARFGR